MKNIKTKLDTVSKFILGIGLLFMTTACLLPSTGAKSTHRSEYKRPVDSINRVKIYVNQVGYEARMPKQAVIETVGRGSAFELVEAASGTSVFKGELKSFENFTEWGGGPFYHVADFSKFKENGTYEVKIGKYTSHEFQIREGLLYSETISLLLDYFNGSRADHPSVLRTDANVPFYDSTKRKDVRGGWYDASGDISKYLSHLSYANFMNPQQIPLTAWVLGVIYESKNINESLKERIVDEAAWGADYLLRVLDDEGYFYINVFDHWSGDMAQRRICAYETQSGTMVKNWHAAFREGGGLSIAALAKTSTLPTLGEYPSSKYLEGAIKAFDHLVANNGQYVDDGVDNIIDDYSALIAATELYAVTKENKYKSHAQKRVNNLKKRLHEKGYFIANNTDRPYWHASDAGIPVIALNHYLSIEKDETKKQDVVSLMKTHLRYLLSVTNEVDNPFGYARQHFKVDGEVTSGFFIPHDNETLYWWQGENARLASLASAALIGSSVDEHNRKEYEQYAMNQLSWILGMNPFGYCMFKGVGTVNPQEYATFPNAKHHADINGGIANGITGSGADGSGIEFLGAPGMEIRNQDKWRWLEQWLPHSTWFMFAMVLLNDKE